MMLKHAVGSVAFAVGLTLAGGARAQLQPPPPMNGPQPGAPAAPAWNPFAPPAPVNQPYGQYQGTSATQQQLETSEQQDSGRGLEVAWANLEGGGSYGNFGSGATKGGAVGGVGVG